LYGINQISVLNKLKYFHVIGGLAPDIMHDLLEGVIPLVLALFIFHCIERKYFTLKQLNHIIANFNCGQAEVVDKLARITSKHLSDHTIRGSATQKWLLAVYPLNYDWIKNRSFRPLSSLFSSFLEISRFVFRSSLSTSQILNLNSLIAEFLTAFKECFPSRRLITKMHHLVHYPRFIREIGLLGAVWCMRYFIYFKSLQRRSGNWINLPWSLSYRHQHWMCHNMKPKRAQNFLKFQTVVPKTSIVSFGHFPYAGQIAQYFDLDNVFSYVDSFSWIQMGSNKFRKNESVVIIQGLYRA
jgi:hypothetical protein